MNIFVGELIGTMLLVLLGDGVVANVLLEKSKGQNSGWIVISAGWGFGVAIAVYVAGWASGAHINPAVTVGLAAIGDPSLSVSQVPVYLAGQFLGGLLGAVLVWLAYLPHWAPTAEPAKKLAVFCTGPEVRNLPANFLCEVIGTAVLLIGVLGIMNENNGLAGGVGPYAVGILVFSIGLSLGGPTGYAINPARDLPPRLAHALLPIAGKGPSDWPYAWVPVVGPILGGVIGALVYHTLFGSLAPLVPLATP